MNKIVLVLVVVIAITVIGLSFQTILENYQKNSFTSANEKRIGEGQKFVDATGKRCLMSETIAGDKCPSSSRGITADGKYDMGISGTAQLREQQYGLNDPFDSSSMNRFDATMGTQKSQNPPKEQETWLENHQGHLKQKILDNDCDSIKEFYIWLEVHVVEHPKNYPKTHEIYHTEGEMQEFYQALKEYKEAYQEFCE